MRSPRYLVLRITAALAALAFLTPATAHAAELGDGAWCWFADPRAIAAHGHIYVGSVSSGGDITVVDYDQATRQVQRMALVAAYQHDDHANPALQIRGDGRVVVYWSAHAGGSMFYRVSVRPYDITSFGPLEKVGTNTAGKWGYTYPNPVHLGDTTYLFWRGGNFSPSFSTQKDGTDTWTPAQTLIQGSEDPPVRPYVKYATDGDSIYVAYTNAHPREADDVNIYFLRIHDGQIYRADGSLIGPLGTPVQPAAGSVVFDRPENAWIWDVAVDNTGHPVVVFATFPSPDDHRYYYSRWNGVSWDTHQIVSGGGSISDDSTLFEPYYSGGLTLDHETPNVVYLSRQVGPGSWRVEQWTTSDGGASWSSQAISDATGKNVRPISPRGLEPFGGSLGVIWMSGRYQSYYDYATQLEATSGPLATPGTTPPPTASPAPTTASVPAASPTPVPAAPVTAKLKVRSASWVRGKVRVKVRCLYSECRRLLAVHARHRVIARGGYRLAAGARVTVRPRMTRVGRMMRHRPRLTVYVRALSP